MQTTWLVIQWLFLQVIKVFSLKKTTEICDAEELTLLATIKSLITLIIDIKESIMINRLRPNLNDNVTSVPLFLYG